MFTLTLLALLSMRSVAALTCGGDKPLSLCCMGVAPWSSNSGVWGNICGYFPSNPSEIVGGRCANIATLGGTCPGGTTGICCGGVVPGPSGQCGLGTHCGTPILPPPPPPPPVQTAPIPADWSVVSTCAQDSGDRILANAVVMRPGTTTPGDCINMCQANGYLFAGVENGNECQCGTGFKSTPTDIDASNCATRCTGNNAYTCGGSWAIQLYQGPTSTETLPDGWSTLVGCAVDNGDRVILSDAVTQLTDNTPATCAAYCEAAGYTIAGVEYGNECHCGNTLNESNEPVAAPDTDCNVPCAGNRELLCGGGWRIQLYTLDS